MGRTEKIENTFDPEWTKTFEIEYFFEEKQVGQIYLYEVLFLSHFSQVQWGSRSRKSEHKKIVRKHINYNCYLVWMSGCQSICIYAIYENTWLV